MWTQSVWQIKLNIQISILSQPKLSQRKPLCDSTSFLIFVCAFNEPLEELAWLEDETIVDGDILGEDELVDLCEESLLLPGVKHVLQTGDQGPDGHLVTPILAQEEHQQGELRRVQQRPGLERTFADMGL